MSVRLVACLLLLLLLSCAGGSVRLRASGANVPAALSQKETSVSLTLKASLKRTKSDVLTLALSPDASTLALMASRKRTELWNLRTGELIADLDGRIFTPYSIREFGSSEPFSPDGRVLLTLDGRQVKLWDSASGRLLRVLAGFEDRVDSAVFSPDGRRIATGSEDGTVRLWETESGRLSLTMTPYTLKKYPRWRVASRFLATPNRMEVAFSPDGQRVLSTVFDRETKLWNAATGRLEAVLGEHNYYGWFSPGGRFVMTHDSVHFNLQLWETETGKLKATFDTGLAAISPDEEWLGVVSYEGLTGLLNLRSMRVEAPLDVNTNFITDAFFSPEGQTFVLSSGLVGHSANIVNVPSGKLLATPEVMAKEGFDFVSDFLKYSEQLSFHPSGRVLLGANRNLFRFWDAATGKQIKEVTEGRDPARFSRDGKLLVTTAKDKRSILVWNIQV